MPLVRYSVRAADDLLQIGAYSQQVWGEAQASRYLRELSAFCDLIATQPLMGRSARRTGHPVRRAEHASHVIFYNLQPDGVRVERVLHKSRVARRSDFKE